VTPFVDNGAAYVFESPAPGLWLERQKLIASASASGDAFGVRLDVQQDAILVGATAHDGAAGNAGAVFYYERSGASWIERQELEPALPVAGSSVGQAMVLNDDVAIISGVSLADSGAVGGGVWVFRRSGSTWSQVGKILANDGPLTTAFGGAIAISGMDVAVGYHDANDACPSVPACFSGAAYVFELAPSATQYGSCAAVGPCGNHDAHGGCRNSTGQGAILQGCGSGSVVTDDLHVEVRELVPGAPAVLYMGAGLMDAPFGDGRRVVASGGAGLFRFGVQNADADGVIARGPGIVAQSQGFPIAGRIGAGQTWHFQCLYRNAAGPCGSGFNLSSGLAVVFGP
jgi:hypothetical protein